MRWASDVMPLVENPENRQKRKTFPVPVCQNNKRVSDVYELR